jgi:hypothetical protein
LPVRLTSFWASITLSYRDHWQKTLSGDLDFRTFPTVTSTSYSAGWAYHKPLAGGFPTMMRNIHFFDLAPRADERRALELWDGVLAEFA